MTKQSFSISKFLTNDWVITIISTMVGVIVGLYLTNYNEDQKLKNAQQKAFDMVTKELKKNKDVLTVYDSICDIAYQKSSYVFSLMTTNKELFIPKDSIEIFKKLSKGMINDITIEETTKKDSVRIRGEMDLTLTSKLAVLDLNHVIWESYKQTNFLNATNFECVIQLEELYQFQDNYNEVNRRFVNMLTEGVFLKGESQLNEFMMLWNKVITMNKALLNVYDNYTENPIDCI